MLANEPKALTMPVTAEHETEQFCLPRPFNRTALLVCRFSFNP